jgi:hypothetical protein
MTAANLVTEYQRPEEAFYYEDEDIVTRHLKAARAESESGVHC